MRAGIKPQREAEVLTAWHAKVKIKADRYWGISSHLRSQSSIMRYRESSVFAKDWMVALSTAGYLHRPTPRDLCERPERRSLSLA